MTVLTPKFIILTHERLRKKSVVFSIIALIALAVETFFCVQTLILETGLNNVSPVASNNYMFGMLF